ncbi:synaptosomal-associated protein 47-like [Montipora foliosa]|uniref:synaptosomal-associated protein 47-like n=1 Tax=Montipora foliosa TaxID=591990 RepID=UPI0035F20C16
MKKIGDWKASYYSSGTKTWKYGRLIIYTSCIRFVEDNEGRNRVDVRIFFEDFFELKKETTSFFFGAITVRVRAVKYWFSSLTDRGHVFNTIEHFWKENLFASSEGEGSCSSEPLRMLYDAQDTLTLAGRTVQKQGQQIDAACSDMNKIHNDLAVADTLIYNLDSWFSKWKIKAPQVQIKVHGQSIVIEKSEYPIVYAKTQRAQHLPGTLVVSSDTLDVLNAQNSLDISFLVREVTEVSVHTPWEATIAQSRIGQTVHTVHLIAARLVHILQKLEVLLPGKIDYEDPPFDTGHENDELDFDEHTPEDDDEVANSRGHFEANKKMSHAEAAKMGQVLQDMKSLALGIQREQDRQLHQLDKLSGSVDKAREIMRSDARKINSLQ